MPEYKVASIAWDNTEHVEQYLNHKAKQGWRLVSIDWSHPVYINKCRIILCKESPLTGWPDPAPLGPENYTFPVLSKTPTEAPKQKRKWWKIW